MGVGRRMKKQGPPPPLDESLVTRKRKSAPIDTYKYDKKRQKSIDTTLHGLKVGPELVQSLPDSRIRKRANGKQQIMGSLETIEVQKANKAEIKGIGAAKPSSSLAGTQGSIVFDNEDAMDDYTETEDGRDRVEVTRLEHMEFSDLDDVAYETDEDLDSGSEVVDSENEGHNGIWSEDENEEDPAELLNNANIEGMSRHLDEKAAQDAANAQLEFEDEVLRTNITTDQPPALHGDSMNEGPELGRTLMPDLQLLRTRITDAIRILDDFSARADSNRSRADYIHDLLKDMCAYYGYSMFLCEKLFNLFPPREAFAFFEANETPRPIVIRTNTLRTHRRELAQALINRGVTLEPIGKWSKIGLQVFESSVPLGATPEYLAGHYMLQAASSFLPVMALDPQEHERILDMASAPGGKVTHISALMRNTGSVFANDSNKARANALIGNIHRLGVKNTIVCNYDAREFPQIIGGFDRVLLDAPCSGTGVIAKDASVKTNKTEKDFMLLPHLQKQLLLSAVDSIDHRSKTGGYVVYSTCSVTVEENEQVVQYVLNKRPNVKLVETGLSFGKEGFASFMGKQFNPDMKMTRRYYPHAYNVDGFFVAKFKKTAITPTGAIGTVGIVTNGKAHIEKDPVSRLPSKNATGAKPIIKEGEAEDLHEEEAGFDNFDNEEDDLFIERALKNALRRKGINPKAIKSKT